MGHRHNERSTCCPATQVRHPHRPGQGKSALLARWAASLQSRDQAHVVFLPVSIRFNTALASVVFTALAARLGEVYGEPVKWADLSPEQWRGVAQSYLQRKPPDDKPVLVILDGVDEAAGWQAGPDLALLAPPAGLRVVLSARYLAGDADGSGWLRRVGWERPGPARCWELGPLTQEGLADVLNGMGFPLVELGARSVPVLVTGDVRTLPVM